jgi:homoserine kinase
MGRKGPQKPQKHELSMALPATSANLGPAFDAAALAFNLFLRLHARRSEEFSLLARGRDREICGAKRDHLILNTYSEVLRQAGKPILPLALELDNDIPIGKGCGSSAAARLAGIALAVHFGKLRWSDARIVGEAARREHHPDNAAACWHGGLAVARMLSAEEAAVAIVKPKASWPLLLAVPDVNLSTEEGRGVLPSHYLRSDAVNNLQNAMLLLAAFVQGRHDLLAHVLEDRMHQPYRAELCPLLPTLKRLTDTATVAGTVLSGAGPSVLMFLRPELNAARVKRIVAEHLQMAGLSAELLSAEITQKGARDSSEWRRRHRETATKRLAMPSSSGNGRPRSRRNSS